MFYPDERSWLELGELAAPVLSAGRPFVTECPLRRQDGSTLWCEMHGNSVDPADRSKGEIWSILDISERKRAESELRRALLHQQELNDIKSRFVAMTSHEFRTPLSTILSSSDLLNHYSERLPASEKQALHRGIETAVQRMTAMMNDVLIIGQAETRGFDLKLAPVDLSSFCLGLVEEFRLSLPADIAIDYQAPQECNLLNLDSQLLHRVLANLLSNAIKYSRQGGTVGLSVQSAAHELVFQVSDQGIGVPAEDLPKLFDSFHRATNVGTIAGTGLGLSIVKKSVERQGGSIEVSSTLGQGTRFEVRIPLPQEPYV
jgi:signal transduction histidine kinase